MTTPATETGLKPRLVSAWEAPVRAESASGPAFVERSTLGAVTGFAPLAQSVIELEPGDGLPRRTGDVEEVLFVLSGSGSLLIEGTEHALSAESGVYLCPGQTCELRANGAQPLRLVSVRIPNPETASLDGHARRSVVCALADQDAQNATAEREFRIVADPDTGLRSATHFVGYIPPGRAPVHFHTYDEVIYVLDGDGVFHGGGVSMPVSDGSCIQLPARALHCLENTGTQTMRVVAVFRPAGSPAAAYYPDGTPAFYSAAGTGDAVPQHAPKEE
jgi:quercetin dioxygenase-like cupin family protein